jgi:hypothetical protein
VVSLDASSVATRKIKASDPLQSKEIATSTDPTPAACASYRFCTASNYSAGMADRSRPFALA